MLSNSDDFKILKLIRSQNIGPRTFYDLVSLAGGIDEALDKAQELSLKGGRAKPINITPDDVVYEEIEAVEKFRAQLISYKSSSYSSLLNQIYDAPPIITCKGNMELLNKQIVAIVGARNCSLNGKVMAQKIAKGLIQHGYIVASGLAKGIDRSAHSAAMPSTIAVIAGGIDHIYPKDNEDIYKHVANDGLLIAELKIGSTPTAQHFPQRNRIISGISMVTIVVEANLRSGSLITARYAAEQGREVLSVPGFPLDPRAQGTNKLIKEGAVLLESLDDVLEVLENCTTAQVGLTESSSGDSNSLVVPTKMPDINDEMRNMVLQSLSSTPVDIAFLMQQLDIPRVAMHVIILELELAGKAIRHPGNKISLLFEL